MLENACHGREVNIDTLIETEWHKLAEDGCTWVLQSDLLKKGGDWMVSLKSVPKITKS